MTQTNWTTVDAIEKKLFRLWDQGVFLRAALDPASEFELSIHIKSPASKYLADSFSQVQDWIKSLQVFSKRFDAKLIFKDVNHKQLGRNQLPSSLVFNDLIILSKRLNKHKELTSYRTLYDKMLAKFPQLGPWIKECPHKALDQVEKLDKLLAVLSWLTEHPHSNIYLRQISLPDVDTKFIENNKSILATWSDLILPDDSIHHQYSGNKYFELRYGFTKKPELVRFRILDPSMAIQGFTDLTLRVDELAQTHLSIDTVYIVENDVTALAFPKIKNAIIIFGRGYGFEHLQRITWLHSKRLFYWGDLDTHGFAILNQLRCYFKQAQSLLMDRETLLSHQSLWITEPKPCLNDLPNLTPDEQSLYDELRSNKIAHHIRLEQESILFKKVELSQQISV